MEHKSPFSWASISNFFNGWPGNFLGALMFALFLWLSDKVWKIGIAWVWIAAVVFVIMAGIGLMLSQDNLKIFNKIIWVMVIVFLVLLIVGYARSPNRTRPQSDATPTNIEPAKSAQPQISVGSISGNTGIAVSLGQTGGQTAQTINNNNYFYAAPDSKEAAALILGINDKLTLLKAQLLAKYPHGFTMIGAKGGIFTAVNDEDTNAWFKFDGRHSTLSIDRSNNRVQIQFTLLKTRDFEIPGGLGAKIVQVVGAAAFGLGVDYPGPLLVPISDPSFHAVIEVIDRNPDSPMICIGFKSGPLPGMPSMQEVLKIIRDRESSDKTDKKL